MPRLQCLNVALFVAALFLFPLGKAIEVYIARTSTTNPSPAEMRRLGVEDPAKWTWADQVGYGLLRRFDDSVYWLLVGVLLANRMILRLSVDRGAAVRWAWPAAIGAILALLYLGTAFFEKGTIFSRWQNPPITGARYWVIQLPEGLITTVAFFVSGWCLSLYFVCINRCAAGAASAAELETLRAIGYTPLLVVTLFTAAVGFIGISFDTADRKALIVVQLTLLAGLYLIGLAYGFLKIPQM